MLSGMDRLASPRQEMADQIGVGETTKQLFERAQLPNEVLGSIWNLADTDQKGELGLTEFIIAMHLLASYRNGSMRALPQTLPAGLYEAASRRGAPRQSRGSRPTSSIPTSNPIPRHFSESGAKASADEWAITPRDKESFDQIFTTLDTANRGFITGDQAVEFFSNSRLPEETLAHIWDLADIRSEGRLNRDTFAVAMFLIRQQRTKKDVRDALPATLPPNLIPLNMRHQSLPPSQATAPAFDNATNINAPKSASEDLFGLAFTPASPQIPQSTGDSALYRSTPPSDPVSPHILFAPQQSSTRKFVPTSFFGTNMSKNVETFQNNRVPQNAPEDLLGDHDHEVGKKLTQETTDLANLSNQVKTLTEQTREFKSKRVSTEQDLSKAQSQKRDFEVRLSQLRSSYEQEVASFKALEDLLSSSRRDIEKLERDIALVDGTYQDMQTQHQQAAAALDTDQKENTRLKERIRQTNIEINELKPQLEKMKSEVRHQKGLVTINKKQLAINEGELEKLRGDLTGTSKELDETRREFEESTHSLEAKPDVPDSARAANPPTSPSRNPFTRAFNSSSVTSPKNNAFDDFFAPTPSDFPPPSTYDDSPQSVSVPPAPAQSTQITSSFLPFRNSQRHDSTSSSLLAVPPASRMGDTSGVDTPTDQPFSSTPSPEKGEPRSLVEKLIEESARPDVDPLEPPSGNPYKNQSIDVEAFRYLAQPNKPQETPEDTPVADPSQDPFTSGTENRRTSISANDNDFNEAFEGFGNPEKSAEHSNGTATVGQADPNGSSKACDEFPAVGADKERDSKYIEYKFDDDFTRGPPDKNLDLRDRSAVSRPPPTTNESSQSQPPPPGAQVSPPTYDQTIAPHGQTSLRRESNHFPVEFTGLLPHREVAKSPSTLPPNTVPEKVGPPTNFEKGRNTFDSQMPAEPAGSSSLPSAPLPLALGASAAPFAYDQSSTKANQTSSQPPIPAKRALKDIDEDFGDLSEAKEADDKSDDEFHSAQKDKFDEFNPVFDSLDPDLRKSDSSNTEPRQVTSPPQTDWEHIFPGLETPRNNGVQAEPKPAQGFNQERYQLSSDTIPNSQSSMPRLARAVSTGTDHDDPILKRLTGMGYPRDVSLEALEKFNYNLDKAVEDLGSKS
ncbi:hypothetical protein MMC07_003964 [Pseudocyphellaria aurata]|nr:hypothetical protein [Pseudocyphellaria aurata]